MTQKGFSIIELMVVIIIVGIMTTIVVSGYANNRSSKALSLGVKQVVNDIRMAQNYAFSALESEGANPWYGIRFSNSNPGGYIIFADKDSDKIYDGASEDFQTINLPDGITIQDLKVDNVDADPVDIVFTSPYGKIYINEDNKNGLGEFIDFKIKIGNISDAKNITASSSGKIE